MEILKDVRIQITKYLYHIIEGEETMYNKCIEINNREELQKF